MLPDALSRLAAVIRSTEFVPPDDQRTDLDALRQRLAREADGHAARLLNWDAPLLVVLGGGTGAGKSTLLNSLAGNEISPAGVLRPTTSAPTLLVAPADRAWADGERALPGMRKVPAGQRSSSYQAPRDATYLAESRSLPPGLALLDTPDIDSVERANRALADLMLDAADVWLWCTTPQTYADDASMAYLRRAARRRTALGVVLNRVRERDTEQVLDDLRTKLGTAGVDDAPLHVIGYRQDAGPLLPPEDVAAVAGWLAGLAEPQAREELRRQTLKGALDALADGLSPLVAAVEEDWRVVRQLQDVSARTHARAWPAFEAELDRGPPLSRAMLRRWADFVGTNRFVQFVETATGRLSGALGKVRALVVSREQQHLESQVREDLVDRLAAMAVSVLDLAAAQTADEWDGLATGAFLLHEDSSLRRAPAELGATARAEMGAWITDIDELIATKFADRRGRARWTSGAVNAVATAAIIAAFTVSGGLTGAEVGIAGAAAVAQQAVLSTVLGERNLTWLLGEIKVMLRHRVEGLAAGQRRRFTGAVAAMAPDPEQAERLRQALTDVEAARSSALA